MAAQVDEVEVFKGSENNLRMMQTYTHRFQCSFVLTHYPFDTQATIFGSQSFETCFLLVNLGVFYLDGSGHPGQGDGAAGGRQLVDGGEA